MKKGQIPIIELVTAVLILLVAFSVLFPEFYYKSKWEDAFVLIKARDSILTIDRIGKLYSYSFNSTLLENFLRSIYLGENLLFWSETSDTFKGRIIVACNCTKQQIEKLYSWFGRIKLNDREIEMIFLESNLDIINEPSDVLLIWKYKDLTPYIATLKNYLNKENGIIQIADLTLAQVNEAQKQIFGIEWFEGGWGPTNENYFIKPRNASQITYQAYKNFYHVPLPLLAPIATTTIPIEGTIQACASANVNQGNFTFRGTSYNFWICDGKSVYFDTNRNNRADIRVITGQNFLINNFTFLLNYIDYNERIRISFKPAYNFTDFLRAGGSKVYPADNDIRKILLYRGNWSNEPNKPIPVVIINGTIGRTAWVADFSRDGLDKVGDDHKSLLLSLLLETSNKRSFEVLSPGLRLGTLTSYVNIVNKDIFEVYRFNLRLGYPF